MLFVVERRTTSAENLRTEQNKLDYNALQQRWTHLLLGIYVHAFTLVNTNAYVEYTHTEEALLIFNQEWDVLETAIQDGSKSFEASQHVTVLGKNKDVILILPAVLQAVTNFYAVDKETFIINVENQQLAISLSRVTRAAYLTMAGTRLSKPAQKEDDDLDEKQVCPLLLGLMQLNGKEFCMSKILTKKRVHPDPKARVGRAAPKLTNRRRVGHSIINIRL